MSEVRPLEVQDLFLALAACPMTAPLRVEIDDTSYPVIGLEPFTQEGPVIEVDFSDSAQAKADVLDEENDRLRDQITSAMQSLELFEDQWLDGDVPAPPLPIITALNEMRKKLHDALDSDRTDL